MQRNVISKVKSAALVKERRSQILQAAVDVFLEKSYHTATIEDVAARVGMSQGAIYTYVQSKDDILYLICEENIASYEEALREALDGVSDPEERLMATIRATVETMYEKRLTTLLVYREAHTLSSQSIKAVLSLADSFISRVKDVLAESMERELIPKTNPRLVANIVTYLPSVMVIREWNFRGRVLKRQMIEEVVQFTLRGIGFTARHNA